MNHRLIYLDNAATSFPKPREVLAEMMESYERLGVSPGRGDYDLSLESAEYVERTRTKIASFFGASDPRRVAFTANATDALNMAIQGIVRPGDHLVSTRLEHNSVLRPLFHLRDRGLITYDLVPFDGNGYVDPDDVARALRPNTKLVIVSHASNVLGTVQPVADIGCICAERQVPLLLDAAQSAGNVQIDMTIRHISAVAFTGHKALVGPTGIGGLVVNTNVDIVATRFGGTGIDSQSLIHTETFPHRLEAGTLNIMGIMGLSAGIDYLSRNTMEALHRQEINLMKKLYQGLSQIDGVRVYSPSPTQNSVPVLTCNVAGLHPADAGTILDGDYGIAVRTGLHCAPLVHTDLGTGREGAIRFSVGPFNTEEEIDYVLEAMFAIAAGT